MFDFTKRRGGQANYHISHIKWHILGSFELNLKPFLSYTYLLRANAPPWSSPYGAIIRQSGTLTNIVEHSQCEVWWNVCSPVDFEPHTNIFSIDFKFECLNPTPSHNAYSARPGNSASRGPMKTGARVDAHPIGTDHDRRRIIGIAPPHQCQLLRSRSAATTKNDTCGALPHIASIVAPILKLVGRKRESAWRDFARRRPRSNAKSIEKLKGDTGTNTASRSPIAQGPPRAREIYWSDPEQASSSEDDDNE
ncbi:hypothetical protein B0H13DRAFT_1904081 [Mycena leptocephala]|nr:hypothetical protein B0H13DRAFT_1904081 [Mycena leptocephala]